MILTQSRPLNWTLVRKAKFTYQLLGTCSSKITKQRSKSSKVEYLLQYLEGKFRVIFTIKSLWWAILARKSDFLKIRTMIFCFDNWNVGYLYTMLAQNSSIFYSLCTWSQYKNKKLDGKDKIDTKRKEDIFHTSQTVHID